MEREGLVEEGQEVEISERSAVTGQYTYLVSHLWQCPASTGPARIKSRKGVIRRIERTEKGFLSDRGGGRIAFGGR